MTSFPRSPRLVKGGLVQVRPDSGRVDRVIVLQFNPDSLSRSFQVQAVGAEGGDRSEALRLKGPSVETIKLEAEIDASDQLETGEGDATELGLHPQLAALETMIHPSTEALSSNHALAASGTLEIIPVEAPLSLFVWSRNRILPVRITEFSITEEAFDPDLNPIRAKVSLGMRVLSVNDVGFDHKGGQVFMAALQQKETLADKVKVSDLAALGVEKLP